MSDKNAKQAEVPATGPRQAFKRLRSRLESTLKHTLGHDHQTLTNAIYSRHLMSAAADTSSGITGGKARVEKYP